MRRWIVVPVVVGTIAWLAAVPAAAGERSAVRLRHRATLDEAGSATIRLRLRCAAPNAVGELRVRVRQGRDAGTAITQDHLLSCDGAWTGRSVHVVAAPGAFEPGRAVARARLTILDPTTGDPLATVRDRHRIRLRGAVAAVLWDQTGARVGAVVSTDSADDSLDAEGADDFVVPAGETWSVTSVFAPGSYGSTHPEPFVVPGVDVVVYADDGYRPGDVVATYVGVAPSTAPDDLTIPLEPALTLEPGTYWIGVQADLSSLELGNSWLWAFRLHTTGAAAVWRNPGGGLGGGSEDWTPLEDFGSSLDFEFDLRGTAAPAESSASEPAT